MPTWRYPMAYVPGSSSVLSLLAGEFTPEILSIWGEYRVHEYLAAPDQRRHVWHCWLALRREGDFSVSVDPTYQVLTLTRSNAIIRDGYGCCPNGLLSALSRLGAEARRPEFYPALAGILTGGGEVAKLIHHSKEIDDRTVFALSSIPGDPTGRRIAEALLNRSVPEIWLGSLIWMIGRLRVALPDQDIEQTILSSTSPIRTTQRLISELPYPAPPFPMIDLLEPVTTAAHLASLAHEFGNCLTDRQRSMEASLAVQAGRQYFYHWRGEQPVLLAFSRFGNLGWTLREACGRRNQRVSFTTGLELKRALLSLRDVCPSEAGDPVGVLFSYFDDDLA
jgi:hypothetical protein